MNKTTTCIKSRSDSAGGFIVPLFAVFLLVLLSFVALAIDLGSGYVEKRRLQIATDAAALAGALAIDSTLDVAANLALVQPEAQKAAFANELTLAELQARGGITVGNWDLNNKVFSPNTAPVNAVRVMAERTRSTFFAHLIGWKSLAPAVSSVAAAGKATGARCVVPFGIHQDKVHGKAFGERIFVGFESPGNWGKLDVGGNMSGYNQFYDAFTNGICGTTLKVGDMVDPAPGFAAVDNGYTARIPINPYIIIPIIKTWPPGSSAPVEVLGFVKAKLIGDGSTGHNWTGEIEFVEKFSGSGLGGPPDDPYMNSRALVQ